MKKTTRPPAARAPAKKTPAKRASAKATPRVARGQTEMVMAILERLAENTARLARAAERLEAAVRPLAAQQSEPPIPPDKMPETPGRRSWGSWSLTRTTRDRAGAILAIERRDQDHRTLAVPLRCTVLGQKLQGAGNRHRPRCRFRRPAHHPIRVVRRSRRTDCRTRKRQRAGGHHTGLTAVVKKCYHTARVYLVRAN